MARSWEWVAGAAAALVACSTPTTATPEPGSSAPRPASSAVEAAVRYLALGDSFTIGTGAGPERSFPARLADGRPGRVLLRNVAVNGYTTEDIVDRELPALAPFAPTYVTLAAGANDIVRGESPATYRAHVKRLLDALRAAHVERVVTVSQPDWSRSPTAAGFGRPEALHARIVEANAILREESEAAGATYVDLFPLMERQALAGQIAADGLHPSAEAYAAWADEIARRGLGP